MSSQPILFLVFNRPDTTKEVLNRIREVQPYKLYIAADGPRKGYLSDFIKCQKTREICMQVDWECDVKTLFREENLGCRQAVSTAIDWFFEQEDSGIILEDDCLPSNSFFTFCDVLLKRYKDHEDIMSITGNNFQPHRRTDYDYYFSRYMHCWGWATWERAWEKYDWDMKNWKQAKEKNLVNKVFQKKRQQQYWFDILEQVSNGKIDSWAYVWTYSIWLNNGINIIPEENLVSNIGFSSDATHTIDDEDHAAKLPTTELQFPLRHPPKIKTHKKADEYSQLHHFHPNIPIRAFRKLKKVSLRIFKTVFSKS
ncbi:MAG: hypothetical protein FH748_09215 [Balneolaceae bacterium]|nr:hypothetical protein [Balneolaceae bacterium]